MPFYNSVSQTAEIIIETGACQCIKVMPESNNKKAENCRQQTMWRQFFLYQ